MEIHAKIMKISFFMICVLVLTTFLSRDVAATMEEDEKECAEELGNLAACIPFVSGTAKHPTKECCDDTSKMRANKPKCLCVLIKESTDPSLSLPINTTLALQMPSACNIDAKVSDCPTILNLPADSPDAKIFKAAAAADSPSITNSPSDHSTKPSSSSSAATGSDAKPTGSTSENMAPQMASYSIWLVMVLALVASILI